MSTFERMTVTALPWLSAAGAVVMSGVVVAKWNDLHPADRAAFGLDAAAFAVASLPLARRHPAGWWTLYLATAVQPVFAGVDVAQDPPKWSSAIGRTLGTVAAVAALKGVQRNYD